MKQKPKPKPQPKDYWTNKLLTEILQTVRRIDRKVGALMATVGELQTKLDAIPPILDAIVADEQALKDMIQALQDQIAAGTPVTQAQLDELDAKADSVLQRLQGIDASVP